MALDMQKISGAAKLLHMEEDGLESLINNFFASIVLLHDIECDDIAPLFNPLENCKFISHRDDIVDAESIDIQNTENGLFFVPNIR